MPSHDWSETSFDWDSLYSAITYCIRTWKLYGRIGSHGKEKYGTFRDHIYLWDGGLHSLLYPGYMWVKRPFLYFKIDRYLIQPFTKYAGLYKLGIWYQSMVYNYAVQRACVKYPHIVDEIVSNLEGYLMVKPGIFGKIDGKKIHKKYWVSAEGD